ncbi:periplasmic sensor signal transduction histidine kinase [Paramagnetospirillum magnetotacticum MS-1]|uniref:histidine kinase n=1 Tax=Paramagnetospirillum magnetotacticum MS-1 TaxID=272627 RepID=A0A0C2YXI2_PARME|nr:ATP-binding protein [Paramagnetospirillum magnetotacticum]KIL99410.1 periplasmic sensor signal transduction histidine kinase [Paramagnetospirillum magnetotacticum MS-1]
MRPASLLRTTTFRLALSYLSIFTVSAIALLALVSWSTSMFIEWQVQETVEAEATGLSEVYHSRELSGLAEIIGSRMRQDVEGRNTYLLMGHSGHLLAGNIKSWPAEVSSQVGWVRFRLLQLGSIGPGVEVLAQVYELNDGYRLLVGRSLADAKRVKSAINRALGWGLALTILLGVVGGYFTSRHLLQRVEEMSRTARRIFGGDMSQRMQLSGTDDEFDSLAESFNEMMDELERLLEGIRTVSDNIAHDLRTPLNRLRSRIDLALLGTPDSEGYRRTLEETLAEADHLLATFNAILTISHAESAARLERFESIDPATLASDVVELYEPLAEEKGLRLACRADTGLSLKVDRHLLFQALANLVDNAVKYTPSGGEVSVTVTGGPASVVVSVADSGPGIPEESREAVLERFVRLDSTRTTPGNGLGLSLVQAVARLHSARLSLDDNRPGLVVRLEFGIKDRPA